MLLMEELAAVFKRGGAGIAAPGKGQKGRHRSEVTQGIRVK